MKMIEVTIYEDGTDNFDPEEVFSYLHPDCTPFWMKVRVLIRKIMRAIHEVLK